jgi:hypothetical protein
MLRIEQGGLWSMECRKITDEYLEHHLDVPNSDEKFILED